MSGGDHLPGRIDRGVATDEEMLDEMAAHVRQLVEQRDILNDKIDKAEQLLQDLSLHLATNRKLLSRATTPERMTVADAARYLRASKNTIKAWIATDAIPHHLDTDQRRYLVKAEVDAWLANDSPRRLRQAS